MLRLKLCSSSQHLDRILLNIQHTSTFLERKRVKLKPVSTAVTKKQKKTHALTDSRDSFHCLTNHTPPSSSLNMAFLLWFHHPIDLHFSAASQMQNNNKKSLKNKNNRFAFLLQLPRIWSTPFYSTVVRSQLQHDELTFAKKMCLWCNLLFNCNVFQKTQVSARLFNLK